MKSINRVVVLVTITFVYVGCNSGWPLMGRTDEKNTSVDATGFVEATTGQDSDTAKDNYNKCFSIENGYEDFVDTDTLVIKTEKGNFFRKVSISDSSFVWSCGRGGIEKIIDTVSCTEVVESLVDWETGAFIGLLKPCGSYCWTNIVIPLNNYDSIIYLSYSAIDFEKMNTVSVVDDYFLVTNLKTRKEVRCPIDKIECIDNFPLFSIKDIKLKGNIISFDIKCKDGSVSTNQIRVGVIDSLD